MPKTYGKRANTKLSNFLEEHDPIEDDDTISSSSPQTNSRHLKRSADTSLSGSPKKHFKKPRRGTDSDDERRLLGDYGRDPKGVAINIPVNAPTRYNNFKQLNGNAFGGLRAGINPKRPTNKAKPGHKGSALSQPRPKPQSFSSRQSQPKETESVQVLVEGPPSKKRRISNTIDMSREDPLIIPDDDEPVTIARRPSIPQSRDLNVISDGRVRPGLSGTRKSSGQVSLMEYNTVERMMDPKSALITGQNNTSLNDRDELAEDDVEDFTRRAKAQRHQEDGGRSLTPPKARKPQAALIHAEESMRDKFTSTDGRRRRSTMESPDILAGAATVQATSPTANEKKTRMRRKGTDFSIEDQRTSLGPLVQGFLLRKLKYGPLVITDSQDYLVVLGTRSLDICSHGSRLSTDPLTRLKCDDIMQAYSGGTEIFLRLRTGSGTANVFMGMQTDRQAWEVMDYLAKKDIKVSEKAEGWIRRVEEKTENELRTHSSDHRVLPHGAKNDAPSESSRVNLWISGGGKGPSDPMRRPESRELPMDSSTSPEADVDPTDSVAQAIRASRASKARHDHSVSEREADAAVLLERPKRTTRGNVKDHPVTTDLDEPSVTTTVPFSQTGQLGPPWEKPLIYPKSGKKRAEVEFRDLERLDDNEFLNDNLIGFFLRFLEQDIQQNRPDLAKKMYFFNTYFFATLTNTARTKKGINYEGVQKWTRGTNLFEHDFVVVPINESAHWYVAVICNLSKLLPSAAQPEADTSQTSQDAVVEGTEATLAAQSDYTEQNPINEGQLPERKKREPLAEIQIDETGDSFKDLNLGDETPIPEVTSDVNRPGSLVERWKATALSLTGMGHKVVSPKKSKKAARRSGVGLQKYDINDPIIITMDSLGLGRSPTTRALKEYLVEEAKAKLGVDIDGSLLRGMTAKGIPGQENFSDCGLYLLAYMEKFILDPYKFVANILRREMDERQNWPVMESSDLRNRLRGFLLDFHKAQEAGDDAPTITNVGRIMLGEPRKNTPPTQAKKPEEPTASKYFAESNTSPLRDEETLSTTHKVQDQNHGPKTEREPSQVIVDEDENPQSVDSKVGVQPSASKDNMVDPEIADDFDEMFGGLVPVSESRSDAGQHRIDPDHLEEASSFPEEIPETQSVTEPDRDSSASFEELQPPSQVPEASRFVVE